MKIDPRIYWTNIPHETNRYHGDEADEVMLPAVYTTAERVEETKKAREYSD